MSDADRWVPVRLPPGPDSLIVREEKPENAEYPMQRLNGWLTPDSLFYRRNHLEYPEIDPVRWRLAVAGRVQRPLNLSLGDLQALPQTAQWTTLECSGNKRQGFEPKTKGVQWADGAIGNAEWAGLPLADLLRRAGIHPDVVEVLFVGADQGTFKETGEQVHFARSLPLAEALNPRVLLALRMNGEPLPHKHGGPLRLVVPTWYAMASVKWITRIELLAEPFRGPYQARDYVYIPAKDAYDQAVPVTVQKVNSTITHPRSGTELKPGRVLVRGAAWSAAEPVAKVEVRVGTGDWAEAKLVGPQQPYAWRLWQYLTPPLPPGAYRITARATDRSGQGQPERAVWNYKGYGNNEMPVVAVRVGLLADRRRTKR